jgi:thiamine-phosphate diphosphorylase
MDGAEQRDLVLGNVTRALGMLEDSPDFVRLMPEVRVNIVYALLGAKSPQDVVAVDGRITAAGGVIRAAGLPRFGASDHMARLLVEVRKYDAGVRAGINFKCDEETKSVVRDYCAEKGLLFGWIDRSQEPPEVAEKDGNSMPWKIRTLVERSGGVPRFFYEGDGWGKEPLFVALAADAVEAVRSALLIAARCR